MRESGFREWQLTITEDRTTGSRYIICTFEDVDGMKRIVGSTDWGPFDQAHEILKWWVRASRSTGAPLPM